MTRHYLEAIRDYSDAIELTGILRMRSILRLKTLCVEACQADCLNMLPEKQRSTEEFINSVNNAKHLREVALNGTLEQIEQALAVCGKDPALHTRKVSVLASEGRFADVGKALEGL